MRLSSSNLLTENKKKKEKHGVTSLCVIKQLNKKLCHLEKHSLQTFLFNYEVKPAMK
jgi:hypothetical protein